MGIRSRKEMNVCTFPDSDSANDAATELLAEWLSNNTTRSVMVAAGNTPLELYRRIAQRQLDLRHLNVFVLDEYVGVPIEHPRNCSNLLHCHVAQAWNIPPKQ